MCDLQRASGTDHPRRGTDLSGLAESRTRNPIVSNCMRRTSRCVAYTSESVPQRLDLDDHTILEADALHEPTWTEVVDPGLDGHFTARSRDDSWKDRGAISRRTAAGQGCGAFAVQLLTFFL